MDEIIKCPAQTVATFEKGEHIKARFNNESTIAVLISGRAHISYYDQSGNENLHGVVMEGESFGKYYMLLPEDETYEIIADRKCKVTFLDASVTLKGCPIQCDKHSEFLETMLDLTINHARVLSKHIHVLGHRSIREKLLSYLEYCGATSEDADTVEIPVSLASLANYLSVDRSAMMREIAKMNKEGIIESEGRFFKVLKN